jgi:hypothetical protein
MTAGEFYTAAGYELATPTRVPQTLRLNAREISGVDDGLSTGSDQTLPPMGTDGKGIITYTAPGVGQNGESSN